MGQAPAPAHHRLSIGHYVDMDGALLLAKDIATGVRIERGRVIYPEENGCGVRLLKP